MVKDYGTFKQPETYQVGSMTCMVGEKDNCVVQWAIGILNHGVLRMKKCHADYLVWSVFEVRRESRCRCEKTLEYEYQQLHTLDN